MQHRKILKTLSQITGILLLIMLALSSGACTSSSGTDEPTQTPTRTITDTTAELAGFYESTVHGFSIHYPPEWDTEAGGTGQAAFTIHNSSNSCVIQIFVETEWQTSSLDELADTAINDIKQKLTTFNLLSENEIQFGDATGYEYSFTGIEGGITLKSKLISVLRENQAFVILAACKEEVYNLVEETIDNIVYSFRLEEPLSLSMSDEDTLFLYSTGPTTLDPALIRDTTSAYFVMEVFSGLVTLNQDLQVIPDIAERWETSDDGKTYTFYLRENARFHDGKVITANDFKYSLERSCEPETASQTAATYLGDIVGVHEKLSGQASDITGVKIIDDHILQITIDTPKSYFLSKLVYPTSFVVDSANTASGDNWWHRPNGSGPFKLKEWIEDELLVLERNDLFHGEMPKLQNAVFRLWSGVPMIMYENGEIDITYVSTGNIERVLDPSNPLNNELVTTPEFSLWYIGFNTTKPPFDDPKIRQAFSYAIDKDIIIELLLKDMVKKADGILPPGMPGYNDQLQGLDFDPEKAMDLIQQSTYGSVSNLPEITFTTAGIGQVSSIIEAIVSMWQQHLGIDISIRQMEPDTYTYNLKKEKDELFDIGWVADYPDPQNFLDVLFHGNAENNTGEYSNPDVDALLEAAGRETDPTTRLNMYQEIEHMLVDDAACLPLYFGIDYSLVKPHVKGFVPTSVPIPWLQYISIEPRK